MSEMGDMTREECNLLLFLETRIVDHRGLVEGNCMNKEDFETTRTWTDTAFVKFSKSTLRVQFSDEAWTTAHKLRRERGERHVETLEQGKDGT